MGRNLWAPLVRLPHPSPPTNPAPLRHARAHARKSHAGTGTFGRVYLCQDGIDGQYHALKVLKKLDVVRLKQVEHIRSEKDILAMVNHPFIVTLYVYMGGRGLLCFS